MLYKVEVLPAGISYQSENNLLDDAISHSMPLEHSCKTGECGVCSANLISGTVQNEHGNTVTKGQILTCQSKALSDVTLKASYYPELAHLKVQTLPCKVASIDHVTDDIMVLTLRFPPSASFDYLPGQYIELSFKGIKRSYSIANAITENKELQLQIRQVTNGKMSQLLFDGLNDNQLMRLEGPKGTFFLRENTKPIIMLATGTGIAPIKAMIEQLVSSEDAREVYVYWGMRFKEELYCKELEEISARYGSIHFHPVLSREQDWNGEKGYVQNVVCDRFPSLENYEIYACGALEMIDDAKNKFLESNLPANAFHSDAFTPAKTN
ncbi:FAD-binding oxidoreductase [Agarivorans sp. 1_MG-2023]|uniref:FAD-binding oxidoreductase n=1 Tax=Agarivorans sp. 1_MG-2023 TaxID=3062634 RepID=UPI0026E2B96B|nr:FAD-binding oxidoreductase [Agarivorans sp. 1_MG-2023]MDO6764793.1 FAD-binding oxidoreductase [Agarivorans sp. 1_MG-2023]